MLLLRRWHTIPTAEWDCNKQEPLFDQDAAPLYKPNSVEDFMLNRGRCVMQETTRVLDPEWAWLETCSRAHAAQRCAIACAAAWGAAAGPVRPPAVVALWWLDKLPSC